MTFNEIEKEFDECWYRDDVKRGLYEGKIDKEWFKSFFKQSFIKYLQSEVERLEKGKHKIYDNWATTHDRDDERFTKLTKEEKSYNQAISDQITHLQAQIKELEA